MKFDVIFIDTVAPYAYEAGEIDRRALGGTEQAVIRLAEALAQCGLNVAVIQERRTNVIMAQAFYLPIDYLDKIETDRVIHIRGIKHIDTFPDAAHFLWCHDVGDARFEKYVKPLTERDATVIAVSDWHMENLRMFLPYNRMVKLYSPIDEACYLEPEQRPQVSSNTMIWLASPHKGLSEALYTFEKIKEKSPTSQLLVTNPGYIATRPAPVAGVNYLGSLSRIELRNILPRMLCLFYPTQFKETFGMIVAEAEAMGTPVATYDIAALKESVGMSGFCKDEAELIDKVVSWQTERPVVSGQERFRIKSVLRAWLGVLNGSR